MFGLEKGSPQPLFQFDLEKDLMSNPEKSQNLLTEIESKITELKKMIREGAEKTEFNSCGVLLHGYTALQKVILKIINKK